MAPIPAAITAKDPNTAERDPVMKIPTTKDITSAAARTQKKAPFFLSLSAR